MSMLTILSDDQRELASALWQAYNAMESTKARHFRLLSLLEDKKNRLNQSPTERERILLSNLLKDHSEQVAVFRRESDLLRARSPEVHQILFDYIGQLNELLSGNNETH